MKESALIPYGLLLAMDGYGAPESACADSGRLSQFLQEFPKEIGMHAISSPKIVRVDEAGIAGLSGFIFIMESHISVHTYEERGFITIDVYSCKQFDAELASRYIADYFGLKSFDSQVLARGVHFNNSVYLKPQMRQ